MEVLYKALWSVRWYNKGARLQYIQNSAQAHFKRIFTFEIGVLGTEIKKRKKDVQSKKKDGSQFSFDLNFSIFKNHHHSNSNQSNFKESRDLQKKTFKTMSEKLRKVFICLWTTNYSNWHFLRPGLAKTPGDFSHTEHWISFRFSSDVTIFEKSDQIIGLSRFKVDAISLTSGFNGIKVSQPLF